MWTLKGGKRLKGRFHLQMQQSSFAVLVLEDSPSVKKEKSRKRGEGQISDKPLTKFPQRRKPCYSTIHWISPPCWDSPAVEIWWVLALFCSNKLSVLSFRFTEASQNWISEVYCLMCKGERQKCKAQVYIEASAAAAAIEAASAASRCREPSDKCTLSFTVTLLLLWCRCSVFFQHCPSSAHLADTLMCWWHGWQSSVHWFWTRWAGWQLADGYPHTPSTKRGACISKYSGRFLFSFISASVQQTLLPSHFQPQSR